MITAPLSYHILTKSAANIQNAGSCNLSQRVDGMSTQRYRHWRRPYPPVLPDLGCLILPISQAHIARTSLLKAPVRIKGHSASRGGVSSDLALLVPGTFYRTSIPHYSILVMSNHVDLHHTPHITPSWAHIIVRRFRYRCNMASNWRFGLRLP